MTFDTSTSQARMKKSFTFMPKSVAHGCAYLGSFVEGPRSYAYLGSFVEGRPHVLIWDHL